MRLLSETNIEDAASVFRKDHLMTSDACDAHQRCLHINVNDLHPQQTLVADPGAQCFAQNPNQITCRSIALALARARGSARSQAQGRGVDLLLLGCLVQAGLRLVGVSFDGHGWPRCNDPLSVGSAVVQMPATTSNSDHEGKRDGGNGPADHSLARAPFPALRRASVRTGAARSQAHPRACNRRAPRFDADPAIRRRAAPPNTQLAPFGAGCPTKGHVGAAAPGAGSEEGMAFAARAMITALLLTTAPLPFARRSGAPRVPFRRRAGVVCAQAKKPSFGSESGTGVMAQLGARGPVGTAPS